MPEFRHTFYIKCYKIDDYRKRLLKVYRRPAASGNQEVFLSGLPIKSEELVMNDYGRERTRSD